MKGQTLHQAVGTQNDKFLELSILRRWLFFQARKVCVLCHRYLVTRASFPLPSDQLFLSIGQIHYSLSINSGS